MTFSARTRRFLKAAKFLFAEVGLRLTFGSCPAETRMGRQLHSSLPREERRWGDFLLSPIIACWKDGNMQATAIASGAGNILGGVGAVGFFLPFFAFASLIQLRSGK